MRGKNNKEKGGGGNVIKILRVQKILKHVISDAIKDCFFPAFTLSFFFFSPRFFFQ